MWSPAPYQALANLHPAGLNDDWADKLAGQDFFSRAAKATFEHYMQVAQNLTPSDVLQLSLSVKIFGNLGETIL